MKMNNLPFDLTKLLSAEQLLKLQADAQRTIDEVVAKSGLDGLLSMLGGGLGAEPEPEQPVARKTSAPKNEQLEHLLSSLNKIGVTVERDVDEKGSVRLTNTAFMELDAEAESLRRKVSILENQLQHMLDAVADAQDALQDASLARLTDMAG